MNVWDEIQIGGTKNVIGQSEGFTHDATKAAYVTPQ